MKTVITRNGNTLGNHERRNVWPPLSQRIRLYNRVLQLWKQGLSYGELQRKIYILEGVVVSKANISRWVRGLNSPLGQVNKFDARPSATLAYIIGVKAGDGSIYKHSYSYSYRFELGVIDEEFAAETGRSLAKLLGRRKPYRPLWDRSNRRWRVICRSILLYEFLQEPLEKLRPYIEHCAHCVAAFLRGFSDSEGSTKGGKLKLFNSNRELLVYIKRLLKQYFGIQTTGPRRNTKQGHHLRKLNGRVYKTYYRTGYVLYIRVQSLLLFHKHVGFTIKRKLLGLAEAAHKSRPFSLSKYA